MVRLPTLYKKTSTGAIEQWSICTEAQFYAGSVPLKVDIYTRHGQVGGKIQVSVDTISEGKNLGKKNETTPEQQADAEALSKWQNKKKRSYVESIEQAQAGKVDEEVITGGIAPMLAHVYSKQGHKIKFPAYVQPKLDGHRCIAVIKNGKCTLWSRTQKPITSVPHIVKELENIYKSSNIVLDGELYNHEYKDRFEELSSLIRQVEPKEGHEAVQYAVYDVPLSDVNFANRMYFLEALDARDFGSCVYVVVTELAANEEHMFELFQDYMAAGFEGLMVRNSDSLYENKRSYNLQKVKAFEDSDYEIIGVNSGRGKMSDKAIFLCRTPEGKEFSCKMKGSLDSLKQYLDEPDKVIGKLLEVQYQNLSADDLIPRFPVGLRIKESL